jgi:hypothetical protein
VAASTFLRKKETERIFSALDQNRLLSDEVDGHKRSLTCNCGHKPTEVHFDWPPDLVLMHRSCAGEEKRNQKY